MRRGLGTVVLVVLVSVAVAAQQPEPPVGYAADRPGYADSPILLRPGQIQIEAGFTWERDGTGAALTQTSTWPQVELHGGIIPRVELSLAWDGLVSVAAPDSTTKSGERSTGLADVRLGAKFSLVNRPMSAPRSSRTGICRSAARPCRRTMPTLGLAWPGASRSRVALEYQGTVDLGAAREEDRHVRAKPAASMSLGTTVVRSLNGFIGVVAESPEAGSRPDLWSVETGAVLALGVRTQIDVWVNRRLSGGPDNWFIGGGIARRLR